MFDFRCENIEMPQEGVVRPPKFDSSSFTDLSRGSEEARARHAVEGCSLMDRTVGMYAMTSTWSVNVSDVEPP